MILYIFHISFVFKYGRLISLNYFLHLHVTFLKKNVKLLIETRKRKK